MLYHTGELVRIFRRIHGHQFKIGTLVVIRNVNPGDYLVRDENGTEWFVTDEEIILVDSD
ncbi:hypothetical protein D3C84_247480 [compost metagenome]